MKTRFDTLDLVCSVTELQRLVGMRVNQIYDIDHRTYLIRLQRSEEKCILLLESGNRIHTTAFEWPKNTAPSGFSMKLRKHLKNKRLESLKQIGMDRMIDLQFGSGEAAYHVVLELYDRGNIVLTDHEMTILNILRPHTEGEKIRFAVKEKYPLDRAHTDPMPSGDEIKNKLKEAKEWESLKKVLNPLVEFGSALIDHVLLKWNFVLGCKIGKDFKVDEDSDRLLLGLKEAVEILEQMKRAPAGKGYIIQKKETKPLPDGGEDFMLANVEFHPILLEQNKNQPYREFETFDQAVDEYYSSMESQKLDLKALAQEREALKKLKNVRMDHDRRLVSLKQTQEIDELKAELITRNQKLVEDAAFALQCALASQMSWPEIQAMLKESQAIGDPVALAIKKLKLETNHASIYLTDPYADDDEDCIQPMIVDIDLACSAHANAKKYYSKKKMAAKKQQKTIESESKALKSAERKTKQTLKEVQAIHSINKARKVYWFEKFYWFITSENYLVIGGRDQQQNELIVKRYLRPGDVYVHADLSGASSVVVKNPNSEPVPPKSLAEAGTMAVAYSVAWEAKVIAGAWWVNHDQVSKTAPTGEYLTTGSFMIRGKKNYLPPCQLVMGLGFLFRLEESSIERHKDERRVKTIEEDYIPMENSIEVDKEIELEDDHEDEEEKTEQQRDQERGDFSHTKDQLNTIEEENPQNFHADSSCSDDDEEESSLFPDTQIKLDLSGSRMKLVINNSQPLSSPAVEKNEEIVFLGDDKPVALKPSEMTSKKGKQRTKGKTKDEEPEPKNKEVKQNEPNIMKRGQKGRLKKMKEKYKDQDEEDRRILMEVLKSAGAAKEDKRKNKNQDPSGPKQGKKRGNLNKPNLAALQYAKNMENADDDDVGPAPEIDMLDQLTGKPLAEDELLFAVPVIAPYNTVLNYKFKVKMMPGTGKRGKAAKTAVAVFLRDKTITPREKDLLKAVKEETIARNIPGKVKISAPQIQKLKK
ncbi:nuclear export mediator factor NEMF homolog [Venturia canescens]|uniref:nuclear export mediator factor NEMF homolog n=1 Tax=Venturia canescens TaxID=32260 RepID=UPI001C9CB4BA|nr:nuclear export mediator factor NEMF homolog [Venturia canescens]